MSIKCIIVDDEPLAVEKIRSFIGKLTQLEWVASFRNASDALEYLRNNPVNLIFLDVQMDEMSGLEMLERMATRPQVILTTAFSEYAVKGYDLAVTDFLLKPYTFDRFSYAVNKAADYLKWQQIGLSATKSPLDYLFVKSGYKLIKLFVDDILYIEGMRDYQYVITKTEKVIASHSIHELEKMLPEGMIRCHKSYIVSLGKINSIERNRIRIGNKLIPIGDAYRDDFFSHI